MKSILAEVAKLDNKDVADETGKNIKFSIKNKQIKLEFQSSNVWSSTNCPGSLKR